MLTDNDPIPLKHAAEQRGELINGRYTFIYFLRAGDFIKIGQSIKWRRRLSNICVASPLDVVPLHVEMAEPSRERRLHERFKNLHHRGEWFRAEQPLLEYIEERKAIPGRSWISQPGGW
jgi:hypothetical protein